MTITRGFLRLHLTPHLLHTHTRTYIRARHIHTITAIQHPTRQQCLPAYATPLRVARPHCNAGCRHRGACLNLGDVAFSELQLQDNNNNNNNIFCDQCDVDDAGDDDDDDYDNDDHYDDGASVMISSPMRYTEQRRRRSARGGVVRWPPAAAEADADELSHGVVSEACRRCTCTATTALHPARHQDNCVSSLGTPHRPSRVKQVAGIDVGSNVARITNPAVAAKTAEPPPPPPLLTTASTTVCSSPQVTDAAAAGVVAPTASAASCTATATATLTTKTNDSAQQQQAVSQMQAPR